MSFKTKFNRLLEHLYDYRPKAQRKEFVCLFGASILFALTVLVPLTAFLIWVGIYGRQFDFVDELYDVIFHPVTVAAMVVWVLYSSLGSLAVTMAMVFGTIRRLNSLQMNRWWVLMLFAPIVSALFLVFLMFCPARDISAPKAVADEKTATHSETGESAL